MLPVWAYAAPPAGLGGVFRNLRPPAPPILVTGIANRPDGFGGADIVITGQVSRRLDRGTDAFQAETDILRHHSADREHSWVVARFQPRTRVGLC